MYLATTYHLCIPKSGEINFKIENVGNACMIWEVQDKNNNRYKNQYYSSQCMGAAKNFSIPTNGFLRINIEGGETKYISSQEIIDRCGYNSATGNCEKTIETYGEISTRCPKWNECKTQYYLKFK